MRRLRRINFRMGNVFSLRLSSFFSALSELHFRQFEIRRRRKFNRGGIKCRERICESKPRLRNLSGGETWLNSERIRRFARPCIVTSQGKNATPHVPVIKPWPSSKSGRKITRPCRLIRCIIHPSGWQPKSGDPPVSCSAQRGGMSEDGI